MNVQFHLCGKEKELKAEHMKPIQNYTQKPHGGFWTSSYEEGFGSDWVQWLLCEDGDEETAITGYLLTPKKDVRLYVIDSFEDCLKLIDEYLYLSPYQEALIERLKGKVEENQLHMFYGIDYEKMKQDYDGLHLTRNGYVDCHLKAGRGIISMFNGFDCESTIWLNWCFDEVAYIETNAKAKENWSVYAIAQKIREEMEKTGD